MLAREIVQICLEACKSYDLPADDYVRVVKSVESKLEEHARAIHAGVADFLETQAAAVKVGSKAKEVQLMRAALSGVATAVRNRSRMK